MERQCKGFTGRRRVTQLRRHLVEKVPVSQVCEESEIQSTQFYRWPQTFSENGALAFEGPCRPKTSVHGQRIAFLKTKTKCKGEVLAERMGGSMWR